MKQLASPILIILISLFCTACSTQTSSELYELEDKLIPLLDEGKFSEAQETVKEMEKLMDSYHSQFKFSPDDGMLSVVHHKLHTAKGRLEMKEGNIEKAKEHLLESGKVSGAPTLNSFGPNMSLAKALLEHKESEVVLTYFELCGKFWQDQFDKTDKWEAAIAKGGMPDFGPNLVY